MNSIFVEEMMAGKGMLWMDYTVVALLWASIAAAGWISHRLSGKESPRSASARWVMAVGFMLIAGRLTLRLIQEGDLPMSPPYGCGLALVCLGYIRLAIGKAYGE